MFLYFYFISVFHKMEIDKFTHSWVSTSIQVITWGIIYHNTYVEELPGNLLIGLSCYVNFL